jgi:hypothetical protein
MTWDTIETGIKNAILAALGSPSFDVDFDIESRVRDESCCRLQWVSIRGVGRPEVRQRYDADDDEIKITVRQDRVCVLDARFESPRATTSASALALAERAHLGMYDLITLDMLPEGVALTGAQVVPVKDFPDHGRSKSGAVLTLTLNAVGTFEGTPIGWVEEVFATGTITEFGD